MSNQRWQPRSCHLVWCSWSFSPCKPENSTLQLWDRTVWYYHSLHKSYQLSQPSPQKTKNLLPFVSVFFSCLKKVKPRLKLIRNQCHYLCWLVSLCNLHYSFLFFKVFLTICLAVITAQFWNRSLFWYLQASNEMASNKYTGINHITPFRAFF